MAKILQQDVWKAAGIESDAEDPDRAAMLVFSIQRNWPPPTDASPAALATWSTITAAILRDQRGVDDRSVRAALLTYELSLTLAQFLAAAQLAERAIIEDSRSDAPPSPDSSNP